MLRELARGNSDADDYYGAGVPLQSLANFLHPYPKVVRVIILLVDDLPHHS